MIYYYAVLMPSVAKIEQLKSQINALDAATTNVPAAGAEQYEQQLRDKGGILTDYIDSHLLLKNIDSIMAAHGASLLTISASPSTDNANKGYDFITINLEAEMSTGEVIPFVKDVESSIPYIYTIESLNVYMPEQGAVNKQRVSMAIRVYYSSEYGVNNAR